MEKKDEITWRDGQRIKRIRQSGDGIYTIPEFAQSPSERLKESFIQVYRVKGELLKTIHLYNRLKKYLMIVVGREPNAQNCNTEQVDNMSMSRNHAAILYTKDGLMVFDLYSRQGTRLNGDYIQPGVGEPIYDGDILRFGACSRNFQIKNTHSNREEAEKYFLQLAKERKLRSTSTKSTATGINDETASCRHILIKHIGSRRPECWKGKITRTREEAVEEITKILDAVKKNINNFSKIAEKDSECSSYSRGGNLGTFTKGRMQPEFEEATFALKVGEVSGIVETQSGFHIILRDA